MKRLPRVLTSSPAAFRFSAPRCPAAAARRLHSRAMEPKPPRLLTFASYCLGKDDSALFLSRPTDPFRWSADFCGRTRAASGGRAGDTESLHYGAQRSCEWPAWTGDHVVDQIDNGSGWHGLAAVAFILAMRQPPSLIFEGDTWRLVSHMCSACHCLECCAIEAQYASCRPSLKSGTFTNGSSCLE